MKNKQNEANGYECVLCETGEGDKHGLECSKVKNYYYDEDLKTDLEWFKLHDIGSIEAKNYILCILNKTPSKDLNFN